MDRADQYDPDDYEFVHATIADNPYFAGDDEYKKTLGQLPEALRRAFLDGEWDVYAGQYFDIFSAGRHTVRAEQVQLEPWTPRWISIDWGFEHPSAVYWHATRADGVVVTYREFVQNRLSPRMLAAAIAERSVDRLGRGDAFAIFIFRRMRLRSGPRTLRLRISWAMGWRLRGCRGLLRQTTIAWAAGC